MYASHSRPSSRDTARKPPRDRSADPDLAGQEASQGQRLGLVEKALQKWPAGQGTCCWLLGQ